VTNKWLDSNEYLVERLQRKQQQQGGSQYWSKRVGSLRRYEQSI
jgi:hypothetical protein